MILDRKSLAAVVCLALLVGCSDHPSDEVEAHEDDHEQSDRLSLSVEGYEAAGIAVAPAGLRTLVPTIQVTGTLSYDENRMAIATARIGGRITRVVADYGQRVSAGEQHITYLRSAFEILDLGIEFLLREGLSGITHDA